MKKDTTTLHQLLQLNGVSKIKFLNFTFQHRYNGVECYIEVWDHEGDEIDYTSDLEEEIAELLRDEITQNNLLYNDITSLFPENITLTDHEDIEMRGLESIDFEVEIGTDS